MGFKMTYNEFIVYCVTSLGLVAAMLLAIIFFQFIMWKIVNACVGWPKIYKALLLLREHEKNN